MVIPMIAGICATVPTPELENFARRRAADAIKVGRYARVPRLRALAFRSNEEAPTDDRSGLFPG
jgi:hypothetical protein